MAALDCPQSHRVLLMDGPLTLHNEIGYSRLILPQAPEETLEVMVPTSSQSCLSPRVPYPHGNSRGLFVKLRRIVSFATLAISVLALVLVLKRPAPVAPVAAPAAAAANAQSFQEKVNQLTQPRMPGQGENEVRINSGELSSALAQPAGLLPPTAPASSAASTTSGSSSATPTLEFPGAVPNIKDYQVSMDGNIVRGQFLTQIAGQDVYLTLAGHLGSKDGYATFDATEVKLGDLSVPASLINGVLQKKLAEQRDQLKLPNNVKDIKVENGELVFVQK